MWVERWVLCSSSGEKNDIKQEKKRADYPEDKMKPSRLTIIRFDVICVFEGLLQLHLTPQTEALQHLSSTAPLLLAAVLSHHLFLYVLQFLIGKVLHQHGLKHLQTTSLV